MSPVVSVDATHTPTRRDVASGVEFTEPPPGLRGLSRFTLDALDDTGFLFALRAVEDPQVRLFLVPPQAYFPDYTPPVRPVLPLIGLDDDDAPVLLVVVHPGQEDRAPTANLLAPVVLNPVTGRALQLVLDGDYPLRAPLSPTTTAA